jgi:hypothetical protein
VICLKESIDVGLGDFRRTGDAAVHEVFPGLRVCVFVAVPPLPTPMWSGRKRGKSFKGFEGVG